MEGNEDRNLILMSYVIAGTLDNPIMVDSFGEEQYAGCTGYPVDSHWVIWLIVSLRLLFCSLIDDVRLLPATTATNPRAPLCHSCPAHAPSDGVPNAAT